MATKHVTKLSVLAAGVFALGGCATFNMMEGDCVTASETRLMTPDTLREETTLTTSPEHSKVYQNHLEYMQSRTTQPACLKKRPLKN